LLVAGKGPIERYAQVARQRGVAARVHFLGHEPRPELLLRAGDAFLFPTKYEAASLAILEALASSLPVITTNVAMAGEILASGVNALLLPNTDDPRPALSAVQQLMLDPSLRRRLALAGDQLITDFSWDSIADQYARLYSDMIGI
jgi:glycosyltransferase involved in cell wall biosynthesis